MPRIHLGVYLTAGQETSNAVWWALEVGTLYLEVRWLLTSARRLAIERKQPPSINNDHRNWLRPDVFYRFDSAQMYRNEAEVGSTILKFLSSKANSSGLEREDIHFTSKLASNSSYDTARRSIKQSVKQCGLGYIDLFLLHSPYGGKVARLASWKAVEDAITDGEVKTGGVSNYGVKHVCDHNPRVLHIS